MQYKRTLPLKTRLFENWNHTTDYIYASEATALYVVKLLVAIKPTQPDSACKESAAKGRRGGTLQQIVYSEHTSWQAPTAKQDSRIFFRKL